MKLSDLVDLIGGELSGDGTIEIQGVAKIEEAKSGELSFVSNKKYVRYLETTEASAVLVPPEIHEIQGKSLVHTQDPYFTFLKALRHFHPPEDFIESGIHPTAVIDESCVLGENVSIGAHVVIGRDCQIGSRSVLLPGVVLGAQVIVGNNCLIHSRVSLREKTQVGNRVIIHDGTVIGSDGFGFAPVNGEYIKIPQVGIVVIEDDVEIGANVTIDRATLGATRIKKGAKLDNLIQVAHNCVVGENTVIAAQAGLSGSTKVGKGVRIGGQAGFAGHLTVEDGAAVGAQAGVSKSVPAGTMVSGYPARSHREELKTEAAVRKLPDALSEIKRLKKQIEELKQQLGK